MVFQGSDAFGAVCPGKDRVDCGRHLGKIPFRFRVAAPEQGVLLP